MTGALEKCKAVWANGGGCSEGIVRIPGPHSIAFIIEYCAYIYAEIYEGANTGMTLGQKLPSLGTSLEW